MVFAFLKSSGNSLYLVTTLYLKEGRLGEAGVLSFLSGGLAFWLFEL